MAKRSVRIRLEDILQAIEDMTEILDGADFATYELSRGRRRGVERCIEIMSEASRYIPPEMTDKFPGTPWPEIRGIGNHLRHGYQSISDLVIWRAATKSVPELRAVVQRMLSELGPED